MTMSTTDLLHRLVFLLLHKQCDCVFATEVVVVVASATEAGNDGVRRKRRRMRKGDCAWTAGSKRMASPGGRLNNSENIIYILQPAGSLCNGASVVEYELITLRIKLGKKKSRFKG